MIVVLIWQMTVKKARVIFKDADFCTNKYIPISDVFELEIGELSRAEPSWIFPSRAELVGFRNRAEPS